MKTNDRKETPDPPQNNIAANKIKGSNNNIIIHAQLPTFACAAMLDDKDRTIERLQVENAMLREYIDHLKYLAEAKTQYIEQIINKALPPPLNFEPCQPPPLRPNLKP